MAICHVHSRCRLPDASYPPSTIKNRNAESLRTQRSCPRTFSAIFAAPRFKTSPTENGDRSRPFAMPPAKRKLPTNYDPKQKRRVAEDAEILSTHLLCDLCGSAFQNFACEPQVASYTGPEIESILRGSLFPPSDQRIKNTLGTLGSRGAGNTSVVRERLDDHDPASVQGRSLGLTSTRLKNCNIRVAVLQR